MTVRLLVGDCRAMLATLPDNSVSMCCTSPPYYSLRAYGTNPQVWGGDSACAHAWGHSDLRTLEIGRKRTPTQGPIDQKYAIAKVDTAGAYCTRCAAWRGELGSEPAPEQFVANLVAVFREVRRVLHPTGVLVLNLGDSMSGSGKGPTGHNGIGNQTKRQGFSGSDYGRAYGRTGTARPGYPGGDCPWSGLCGECRAAWFSRTLRSDDRPVPESAACGDAPSRDHTESRCLSPDSSDSGSRIPNEQSCLATPDQQPSVGHAGEQPPASPESTTGESSPRPRGACSHCANCGVCLSGIHASSGAAHLSIGRLAGPSWQPDCTEDSASLSALLERHTRCTPTACAAFEPPNTQENYTSLPPKNLLMMPFRVAIALQADGWILRSVMPWVKKSSMPESVSDRPSNALEWLFLFSKQARYFWDAEAIRQQHAEPWRSTGRPEQMGTKDTDAGVNNGFGLSGLRPREYNPAGRAFRNTDPWFLSLDAAIADARADLTRLEAMRATGGVLCDDGLPLAVDINPAAYKEAHFATYPPALVVPFVKAGTSERGCCPRCLAPWGRVVERERAYHHTTTAAGKSKDGPYAGQTGNGAGTHDIRHGVLSEVTTLGWAASCKCEAGAPIPTVVLDPFAGSGTTLLVADRLGRDAVGIELSPEYARMSEARIAGDAPMLAAVETTAGDYAPLGLFGEAAS